MKNTLANFSEDQLRGILRFTQILAGEAESEASFADDDIDRQIAAVTERRNSGRGNGRVLVDKTEEDRETRRQVRAYLKKRKLTGSGTQLIIRPGEKT